MSYSVNSFHGTTKNLFTVVFERDGNVFFSVLPYCAVNCALFAGVASLEKFDFHLGFSPTGHGLMTLLVSFLVISKVNLTYERFRLARHSVGGAFLRLRELNQLVITLLEANRDVNGSNEQSTNEKEEIQKRKAEWKAGCHDKIVALLESTRKVLQSGQLARFLARNDGALTGKGTGTTTGLVEDPMEIVQDLRFHLYLAAADQDLQMLERIQLLSKLGEFVADYRQLLDLASTPLPFSLIQMGRAFLFIWTFSMPLVLREGPFNDMWSAMVFLFFLTYGFIGLELVAMQLATPFGDGPNDIRVTALCEGTMAGMERDLQIHPTASSGSLASVQERRQQFAGQRTTNMPNTSASNDDEYSPYHSMHFGA